MLNGNSMYFYVFWELIYFYVICIYVIWETTMKNFCRIFSVISTGLRHDKRRKTTIVSAHKTPIETILKIQLCFWIRIEWFYVQFFWKILFCPFLDLLASHIYDLILKTAL